MQKNHISKTLAVGIICLFVGVGIHPAFAVDTKQNIAKEDDKENKHYVDPNIHLKRIHLPILKRSLDYYRKFENSDVEIEGVVEEIINLIEVKGEVNSEDVENILINSEMSPPSFYTNCKIVGHAIAGTAFTFPLFFISFEFGILFGMGGILFWDAFHAEYGETNIEFKVGPKTYTWPHEGMALGFFGTGHYNRAIIYGYDSSISINGYALLVSVIEK